MADRARAQAQPVDGDGYALFTLVLKTFWHNPIYKPLVDGLKLEMRRPFLGVAMALWDLLNTPQQKRWAMIASSTPGTRPSWESLEYEIAHLVANFIMYVHGNQRVI